MASFTLEESLQHPLDYRLLQSGPVARYKSRGTLREDLSELSRLGHVVTHVCMDSMRSAGDLAGAIAFTGWHGRSWDALQDLLSDLDPPAGTGRVLALEGCDAFQELDVLISVLADACWGELLLGQRLICIVQLDDDARELQTPARDLQFNPREWLRSSRERA